MKQFHLETTVDSTYLIYHLPEIQIVSDVAVISTIEYILDKLTIMPFIT